MREDTLVPAQARPEATVVVTPVFEDTTVAARLFAELSDVLGEALFIVAVDDGSVVEPLDASVLGAARGIVLRLKRNMGHQRAIATGLTYVAEHLPDARCVLVMDSDGEDRPESLPDLIRMLDEPDVDVVVAERRRRVETLRFRVFYALYRRIFRLLTGRRIAFGNFMALKPTAVRRLVAMQELWTHVASCVLGSRLRIAYCPLDRGARYAGQSKMSFVGLVLHGFRGAMVFAEDVLVRVGIACAAVALLTVGAMALAVVLKVAGFASPGWFSVTLGILLLMFLQTGTLTLLGLMLAGAQRAAVLAPPPYQAFVESVQEWPANERPA